MRARLTLMLCLLLAGCGGGEKEGGQRNPQPAPAPGPGPGPGELTDLNGLPVGQAALALIPRLAERASQQSEAELSRALDEEWKINCQKNCFFERK